MPSILLGRVRSGAEPLTDGKGVNDTYVGLVDVDGVGTTRAYIKDLPSTQLSNELLAAGLALCVGLPVPQPILAIASPQDLSTKHGPKVLGETLVFASTDEGAQSAMLMIRGGQLELPRLRELLSAWSAIHSAVAFDCWIANGDRHRGNLLLKDGGFFLVDHSHAFTGAGWNAASLARKPTVRNQLAINLRDSFKDEAAFLGFMSEIEKCQSIFGAIDLSREFVAAHTNGLIGAVDLTALLSYLADRCAHVCTLVSSELGRPRLT